MRILITILIVVQFWGPSGAALPPTNLSKTFDDLSILSRITNAISLEAGAIKHDIKIREVITEVLKVEIGNFSELIKLDVTDLVKVLDDIHHRSQDLLKGFDEDVINEIARLNNLLLWLMEDFSGEEASTYPFLNYYDGLRQSEEILGCGLDLTSNISSFAQVLNGLVISDQAAVALLTKIQKSKEEILKCMDLLSNYYDPTSKFQIEVDNVRELNVTRTTVQEIWSSKILPNFGTRLNTFRTFFAKVVKSMAKRRRDENSGKMIELAKKLLNATIIRENQNVHRKTVPLTSGFLEHGDMSKVKTDLKSKWFTTNISKGKSTEALEKALGHFFSFAEKMRLVEDSWMDFYKSFENSEVLLELVGRRFEKVEEFEESKNGNEEQFLKEFESDFETCYKQNPVAFKADDLINFDKEYKSFELLARSVGSIQDLADLIKGEIKKSDIQKFLEELGTFKYRDNFEKVKSMSHYEEFEKLGKKFQQLETFQKSLDTVRLQITVTGLQTNDFVKTSNLKKLKGCYLQKKFNPRKLDDFLNYARTLSEMKDMETYQKLGAILKNFINLKVKVKIAEDHAKGLRRQTRDTEGTVILKLQNSRQLADHLGSGIRILNHMKTSLDLKAQILESTVYPDKINDLIIRKNPHLSIRKFWDPASRKSGISKFIEELELFNSKIGGLKFREVFTEASKIRGLPEELFSSIHEQIKGAGRNSAVFQNSEMLKDLDLDFSSHKGELNAAALSFDGIKDYFDEIFGLKSAREVERITAPPHPPPSSPLTVVLICVAIFILLLVLGIVAYGFTANGKKQYTNLYLYFLGKPHHFEKRWRYSLFMDRVEGKNFLCDAVREINATNVLKAVKRGAYIDVCNKYGNTPLHVASMRGYVEIVEILIRHGADRSALNAQNKTPEQMIPGNYRETHKDKIERFEKIEKIFDKLRNRKFRISVPEKFPTSSFHIYIEERTDDDLTNEFTNKYQAITSDEALPTTTHCIVKTSEEGILETDDVNLLVWIFNGVIIVKDAWMPECIRDIKLISKDADYLVEKVKYKGVIYDTVIQWSTAMAKGKMPYLYGVSVVVVMKECANLTTLANIVATHGGIFLEKFPEKEQFNKGSHPYLHQHLGPIFIIHDGTTDLTIYKNDVDKMFTVMTEVEFIHFMLRRDIRQDFKPNPIPVQDYEEY